jgi:beta-carotene hydroxylase
MQPPTEKTKYPRPDVAWPTIFLFGSSAIGSIISILLGSGYILPFEWCAAQLACLLSYVGYAISLQLCYYLILIPVSVISLIISSACSYAMFTVAHDAIHGAVAKNRNVNNVIGFMSQLWLGPSASWHAIKHNHLTHHAHTNDSVLDPDYWCSMDGPGGYYLTPIRWLTVDVSYLLTYVPEFIFRESICDRLTFILYEIVMVSLLYMAYQAGFTWALFQFWIIPSRIAITLLAFAFDFLPHYPHDITKKENKYQTTTYISTNWVLRPFLSLIIFYQNYHIAHHLVPIVPFYKYKEVWDLMKDKWMTESDIRVRKILPMLGVEDLPQSPSQKRD